MAIPVVGHSLGNAQAAGVVTPQRRQVMEATTRPVSAKDLGIDPDLIETDRATLCTYFLDDSGSMERWVEALIRSYNRSVKIIAEVQTRHEILIGTMALSGEIVYSYAKRKEALRLNREVFRADYGATPLHRQVAQLCRLITEKQGQLAGKGIPTRTMSLIMSDGEDTEDDRFLEAAQSAIAQLQSGYKSKVYGVAFGNAAHSALLQMGLQRKMILPAGNEEELATAFAEFSQATSAA